MVQILDILTKDILVNFQNLNSNNKIIIIKFGATWCRPCQEIKKQCETEVQKLSSNIAYIDIDIDQSSDLYRALKTKKMIKGVPTLLAYYGGKRESNVWYIPNDSISGNTATAIDAFFKRCVHQANLY